MQKTIRSTFLEKVPSQGLSLFQKRLRHCLRNIAGDFMQTAENLTHSFIQHTGKKRLLCQTIMLPDF